MSPTDEGVTPPYRVGFATSVQQMAEARSDADLWLVLGPDDGHERDADTRAPLIVGDSSQNVLAGPVVDDSARSGDGLQRRYMVLRGHDIELYEAWRAAVLSGVAVVIYTCLDGRYPTDLCRALLQAAAANNGLWVVALVGGGNEGAAEGLVIDPYGIVAVDDVSRGPYPRLVDLSMDNVVAARRTYFVQRDSRQDLDSLI